MIKSQFITQAVAYFVQRFLFRKEYLIAESSYGIKFKFKTADAVGRKIYKSKDYEPTITNFVLNEITFEPGDIVLDVGANIGWYSLILAKCKPGLNIYAFEPDTLNYRLLTDNIALNKINSVVAINHAVSNNTGSATLYKYDEKNLGRHSILPIFNGKSESVTTVTLDDFMKENNISDKTVRLLKIDVEGFEGNVLKGALSTLPKIKYIIHEFSPDLMNHGDTAPETLINMLFENGFKPYEIVDNKAKPLNLKHLSSLQDGVNILWKSS